LPEDKTIEVKAIYKPGYIGPVKIEIRRLDSNKPVEVSVAEAIELADRIRKEIVTVAMKKLQKEEKK